MELTANSSRRSWRIVGVEDVKANGDNALATGPFGSSVGTRFFQAEGVPLIRGNNLSNDGKTRLVEDGFVFISNNKAKEFRRSTVVRGDLIFTCWGTITQVGLIDSRASYQHYVISNKQMKFTPNPQKADSVYLFYAFCSEMLQSQIRKLSIGTSVPGFNLGQLRALRFFIPDLPEQKVIAQALSDIDGLLVGLDRLITKKRGIKMAVMNELLTGHLRLPGFSEKWVASRLGDVVQIRKGQLLTRSSLRYGHVPVVAGGKQPAYYHAIANRMGRTITISASGANAGFVALYNEPIFASDCSTISESNYYNLDYVYYQLLRCQCDIYKSQTGGAQPHVHASHLTNIPMAFPSVDEQVAIVEVLSKMDEEIKALELKKDKYGAVKVGMMQQLLTGKVRLI